MWFQISPIPSEPLISVLDIVLRWDLAKILIDLNQIPVWQLGSLGVGSVPLRPMQPKTSLATFEGVLATQFWVATHGLKTPDLTGHHFLPYHLHYHIHSDQVQDQPTTQVDLFLQNHNKKIFILLFCTYTVTIYSNIYRTTHKYGNILQMKIEKYLTIVCTYM